MNPDNVKSYYNLTSHHFTQDFKVPENASDVFPDHPRDSSPLELFLEYEDASSFYHFISSGYLLYVEDICYSPQLTCNYRNLEPEMTKQIIFNIILYIRKNANRTYKSFIYGFTEINRFLEDSSKYSFDICTTEICKIIFSNQNLRYLEDQIGLILILNRYGHGFVMKHYLWRIEQIVNLYTMKDFTKQIYHTPLELVQIYYTPDQFSRLLRQYPGRPERLFIYLDDDIIRKEMTNNLLEHHFEEFYQAILALISNDQSDYVLCRRISMDIIEYCDNNKRIKEKEKFIKTLFNLLYPEYTNDDLFDDELDLILILFSSKENVLLRKDKAGFFINYIIRYLSDGFQTNEHNLKLLNLLRIFCMNGREARRMLRVFGLYELLKEDSFTYDVSNFEDDGDFKQLVVKQGIKHIFDNE